MRKKQSITHKDDFVVFNNRPKQYSPETRFPEKMQNENVTTDLSEAFEPKLVKVSIEKLAKKLVTVLNQDCGEAAIARARTEYRNALREHHNTCFTCGKPIKVKVSLIASGTSLESLNRPSRKLIRRAGSKHLLTHRREGGTREVYADIPEHHLVMKHETKRNKYVYRLVPETRVFNLQCKCLTPVATK